MPLNVLTRKSMGGVRIDTSCRVLTADGTPIPGLFAVGEVSGFGGLNGNASLEATFIAPAMLQGRIVGRLLTPTAMPASTTSSVDAPRMPAPERSGTDRACEGCHDLRALTARPRAGYWHFERVHRAVLDRGWTCTQCHGDLVPFNAATHRVDRLAQIDTCVACHVTTSK